MREIRLLQQFKKALVSLSSVLGADLIEDLAERFAYGEWLYATLEPCGPCCSLVGFVEMDRSWFNVEANLKSSDPPA